MYTKINECLFIIIFSDVIHISMKEIIINSNRYRYIFRNITIA